MRQIYSSGLTPQQKLVGVNNKFGNTGIKDQQGTSRIIYDSLPIVTGQTTYRFFEDSASRSFPFTNTGSDGNKLGVGDTMVISQVLFYIVTSAENDAIVNGNFASFSALSMFNFEIANNQVIKKVTLTESLSAYNENTSTDPTPVVLETQIVLPPLLPYVCELRLPIGLTASEGARIFCQIIGVGGIIAPRTTF